MTRPEIDLLRQRIVRYAAQAAIVVLAGALLLVAVATAPVLFGYHTYIVTGSSMEPTLDNGSVAVTHPTSERGLEEGDIIAFETAPGAQSVLHRIVGIQEVDGRRSFVTQGDANAKPDASGVTLSGAGDKLVYAVPYAGYILEFANSVLGRAALIGVPGCYFVFMSARSVRRNLRAPKPKPEPVPSSFPPARAAAPAAAPPLLASRAHLPARSALLRDVRRRPPLEFAPLPPVDIAAVRASRAPRDPAQAPVDVPSFVRTQALDYRHGREGTAA